MNSLNPGGPHKGCLESVADFLTTPARAVFIGNPVKYVHTTIKREITGRDGWSCDAFLTNVSGELIDCILGTSMLVLLSPFFILGTVPTGIGFCLKKIAMCTDEKTVMFQVAVKAFLEYEKVILSKQYENHDEKIQRYDQEIEGLKLRNDNIKEVNENKELVKQNQTSINKFSEKKQRVLTEKIEIEKLQQTWLDAVDKYNELYLASENTLPI